MYEIHSQIIMTCPLIAAVCTSTYVVSCDVFYIMKTYFNLIALNIINVLNYINNSTLSKTIEYDNN